MGVEYTMRCRCPGCGKWVCNCASIAQAKLDKPNPPTETRVIGHLNKAMERIRTLEDLLSKMTCAAVELNEAVMCAAVDLGDNWTDYEMIVKAKGLFDGAMHATNEATLARGGVCSFFDGTVSEGARFNARGFAEAAFRRRTENGGKA